MGEAYSYTRVERGTAGKKKRAEHSSYVPPFKLRSLINCSLSVHNREIEVDAQSTSTCQVRLEIGLDPQRIYARSTITRSNPDRGYAIKRPDFCDIISYLSGHNSGIR
jgi:hypothetical protein